MYGFADLFVIALSHVAGHDNVGACGKSKKKIGHKIYQSRGGAHRRKRILACKVADNDYVRSVEKKL